jgi:hypothetical protein
MNVRSLKLAGAAAGVFFLVGAAPNVFAQTEVLSMANYYNTQRNSFAAPSVFTFSGPLILTHVGFATVALVTPTFSYKINNGVAIPVTASSTITDSYGVAWHTLLNPVQMNNLDTVTLNNYDGSNGAYLRQVVGSSLTPWTSTNPGVTYSGSSTLATGNLRVSNPGSNVAPEPGSIALLLTGGGALAGIALRRRRNAG